MFLSSFSSFSPASVTLVEPSTKLLKFLNSLKFLQPRIRDLGVEEDPASQALEFLQLFSPASVILVSLMISASASS